MDILSSQANIAGYKAVLLATHYYPKFMPMIIFGDTKKVDLPIRDVVQRYTDSTASTLVDWPGYNEFFQSWIWTMKDGTGVGAANLPWVVIFEAEDRPKGNIKCRGEIGAKSTVINIPFRQQEWPITDDQPNAEDVGTGDASNVE